jgi:hypothetical protein
MKQKFVLQTSLTETAFIEILRESFQDFELQDYTYHLFFKLGIKETNNDGSIKFYRYFGDYEQFYGCRVGKKIKVTYKYVLVLDLRFKPNGVINRIEFDDFFDDGITKLNCLLEKYNIEIPYKKLEYNKKFIKCFSFYEDIYGEELQLPTK